MVIVREETGSPLYTMAEPRVKAEVLPKFDVRGGLRGKPQLGLGESGFQAGNKREKRRQVGGRCKLRRKEKKGGER